MRGLYAILDITSATARRVEPVSYAAALLAARPAAFQIRAKGLPPREFLALLRAITPICRRFGVPLVANDRPDLAALAGCDAVHVGQEDMPIEQVRRIAPGLRVGISTHTPEQLVRAVAAKPFYVAYGPVFSTISKDKPDPVVGLEGLAEACAIVANSGVPLVAIGGITLARAADVAVFADCAASIAALYTATPGDLAGVTENARALHAALSRGSGRGYPASEATA